MKKIAILAAVALLALAPSATAASAAPEPKMIGACVPKNTKAGFWVLERRNLSQSRHGACPSRGSGKATKVTLITFPGWMPQRIVFQRSTEVETCNKVSMTSTTWTYGCIKVPVPVASPSPSPSSPPPVSPSPTFPPATPPATPPPVG